MERSEVAKLHSHGVLCYLLSLKWSAIVASRETSEAIALPAEWKSHKRVFPLHAVAFMLRRAGPASVPKRLL